MTDSLASSVIPLLRDTPLAGYIRSNLAPDGGCALWTLGSNAHGSALVNFEGRRMYVKTIVTCMHWTDDRGFPDDREALEELDKHIARQRGVRQNCGNKLCFSKEHLTPIPPGSPGGCSRARAPVKKDKRLKRFRDNPPVRKKQR